MSIRSRSRSGPSRPAAPRSGPFLIPERRDAIRKAFEMARPADIVLLAGMGHVDRIMTAEGRMPWNEAEIARETLNSMGYRR